MSGFSDYWENEVLDHLFGKVVHSAATIHVGLSRAEPGEDGSGLSEPSGIGYARVQTAASDWDSASEGVLANAVGILFAQASGDWGTVTHFALFDAASGGNILAWGELGASQAIDDGDTAEFGSGDLTVSLD